MIGKLLCKLGMHKWHGGDKWYPDFHAPIITRYESRMECSRCGKVDELISRFDEVTGQLIDMSHNGVVSS